MKKYTIKDVNNNSITIYAKDMNEAIEMYQKTCNDVSIHHEWLMEHAKKLLDYAKEDNFRAVAREAENLIDGMKNNKLI